MALSAIEQLRIIAGEASPGATDLLSLVLQTGAMVGQDFSVTQKTTVEETLAHKYRVKYLSIVSGIFKNNPNIIAALRRLIIIILGDNSVTFSQVVNASDSAWEVFVFDNMDEAIEYLAGITPDEKAAYSAL
jgi:hypothetical protein